MRADPVPISSPDAASGLIGRVMTSTRPFCGPLNFDRMDVLEPPFADIGSKFPRGVVLSFGACDFESADHSNRSTMKNDKDRHEGETAGMANKDPRQDRLKQALRENLKRRKSQARARGDVTTTASNGDDLSPHDGSGRHPDE